MPLLNHPETVSLLREFNPDFLVRVSGGILRKEVFSVARIAALNIHHGIAPQIRGMWSIPWALLEERADWIGATVHVIDAGIDTGAVIWSGGPQLAPGDQAVDLFFRSHLEAVESLVAGIRRFAEGWRPQSPPPPQASEYRTAPGLLEWFRYLMMGRGRRARILLERGVLC